MDAGGRATQKQLLRIVVTKKSPEMTRQPNYYIFKGLSKVVDIVIYELYCSQRTLSMY